MSRPHSKRFPKAHTSTFYYQDPPSSMLLQYSKMARRETCHACLLEGISTLVLSCHGNYPVTSLLNVRNIDEKATLILILKTAANEDDVRTLLPSLEITLAAHATDAVPQGSGNAASASGKHDLTSKTISATDVAEIVSGTDCTYVVWKPVLHLSRPRTRLQRPAIYFTAHLTMGSEALDGFKRGGKDYLKSFEPLPANVLEPLNFDPSLSEVRIHLSETRITKVAPSAGRVHDDIKPVRGASKRAFPVVPALFTRVRYSSLPDAVVASLHLETTQLVTGTILIKSVDLDIANARIEPLCPLDSPKENRAGDEIILLYELTQTPESAVSSISTVSVKVSASVLQDLESQIQLEVRLQAQVDLSQTASKPSYKWSRPLSGTSQQPLRPLSQNIERPASIEATHKAPAGDSGIILNFTAPATAVRNEVFKLDVQCINRSSRLRRFALVVLQPKRTHTKSHEQQATGSENTDLMANLFNAPPLERQKPPDVLDLNPDVRIGPLPPGACFETQMKFRAMTTGVLDLGVIRIVDLETRQTVDVRELPDVIALDTATSGDAKELATSQD